MSPIRLVLLAILIAGCHQSSVSGSAALEGTGKPILPDSTIVDSVVTLTHAADAFTRAPQFTVDTTPLVVFDAGTNLDFDLTHVYAPLLLADGRLIATPMGGNSSWVMLFNADGKPARILARSGEGPREVRSPSPHAQSYSCSFVLYVRTPGSPTDTSSWSACRRRERAGGSGARILKVCQSGIISDALQLEAHSTEATSCPKLQIQRKPSTHS